MAKHFTNGLISRADGAVKSPFVIKAVGGGKKKKPSTKEKVKATGAATKGREDEMPGLADGDSDSDADSDGEELPNILRSDSDGLREADADDGRNARIGLGVTRSGSMVWQLFPAFCRHFVETVLNDDAAVAGGEPRQGKGCAPPLPLRPFLLNLLNY